MSVRSALPWPFRWVVLAIVFGFCAAIGLWAFELGKDIAGLEKDTKEDLQQARAQLEVLRAEAATLKESRDKAQSIANTVDTLLTSEKVVQERLATQNKQLQADNQSLRDDLGFFEKLIPTTGVGGIAIRSLQAEVHNGREIKWQLLVIQAVKNPSEFNGRLELSFTGVQNGKPWVAALPGGAQAFKLKQYGRIEGVFELPPQTVVKGATAKVMEGVVTKATQSIKL
jgi:type II secretory pathway pseudopilin PulG